MKAPATTSSVATSSARRRSPDAESRASAGDQAGLDYYETDVTLEELIEIMFEDLDLPNLERKHHGFDRALVNAIDQAQGLPARGLRVPRSAANRPPRRSSVARPSGERPRQPSSAPELDLTNAFPFDQRDLRYKHRTTEDPPRVQCRGPVHHGHLGLDGHRMKKYLARSFFFLLFQFVSRRYENVELVFIAPRHRGHARSTEEEFFTKGESGGTFVSSGYRKALDVISDRYHPDLWNIYAFHCSDGDNFGSDTPNALKPAARKSCARSPTCSATARSSHGAPATTAARCWRLFRKVDADNFQTVLIERKEDVWPSFKAFLNRDREAAPEVMAPVDWCIEASPDSPAIGRLD